MTVLGGFRGAWCCARRTLRLFAPALGLCLLSPSMAVAQSADTATGVGSQFELTFWQSVAASNDVTQYEAYLSRYPNGTFSALARAKIAALRPASPAPATPAAPVPAPVTPVVAPPVVAPPAPAVAPPVVAPPAPAVAPPVVATPAPAPQPVTLPPPPVVKAAAAPAPAAAASPAPAVNAAPVPQPVQPFTKPPPPVVRTAAPAAAPAPLPAPGGPMNADALRALSQSQGIRPGEAPAPAPVHQAIPLPPRPALDSLPPFNLPATFCSAVDRNAFYDERYKPAMDIADTNNQRTIAHMKALRDVAETARARGDVDTTNLFAAETEAYDAIAKASFAARSEFDSLFSQLMAVPIAPCSGAGN